MRYAPHYNLWYVYIREAHCQCSRSFLHSICTYSSNRQSARLFRVACKHPPFSASRPDIHRWWVHCVVV